MKIHKYQANLILLMCAAIWGTSYTFIKQATGAGMQAGSINACRGLILAVMIYIFFHKAIHKMNRTEFRLGVLGGLINFAVVQLQTTGLRFTTPSNSSFLTSIYVLFVPFVTWIVFKTKPEKKVYPAIVLCIIGMLFLTGILQNGFDLQLGDILTIMCSLFVSFQIVYYTFTATDANPLVMAFMLGATQFVVSSLYTLIFEHATLTKINWSHAFWPIIILGITASFISQTLQIFAQKYTDPTSAGLVLMTESLFASSFSVLMGLEAVTQNLLIGGALIFCSLLITQINIPKFRKSS